MATKSQICPRWLIQSKELPPPIHRFFDHLRELNYSEGTVAQYHVSMCHFIVWLDRAGVKLSDVHGKLIEKFVHDHCACLCNSRPMCHSKHGSNVRQLIRFLARERLVDPIDVPAQPLDNRLLRFGDWLRIHHGLAEATIKQRIWQLDRFLPVLGGNSRAYTGPMIREVIQAEAKKHRPQVTQLITTALRSYLRFLAAHGECQPFLDRAVPSIARWRLANLPKYVSPKEVEQIVASCNVTRLASARDKAILLLLARLGLRAGDIFNLRMDDISWKEGTIRVFGKGRRGTHLPLPQDAGDALLSYIEHDRPPTRDSRVFQRALAPYKPISSSTVISHVVERAIRRAGLATPSCGTNLLRHSAATAMLRGGASLDLIGAVLRHKSPDTTLIYAKLDTSMLKRVAQPWLGGDLC
jgi:integrase/recombinase XerD